jgi:hypothetical protein
MPTGGKGVNALNSPYLGRNLSVKLTLFIQNIGNNPEITTAPSSGSLAVAALPFVSFASRVCLGICGYAGET